MSPQNRIAADTNVPIAPRVEQQPVLTPTSIATAQGEAVARLGQTIAAIGQDVAQRFIDLRRVTQYNQKSSEAHISINDFVSQEEQKGYDFADPEQGSLYQTSVNAGVDKIISQTLEKVKDPEVRAKLIADLGAQKEHASLRAADFARSKTVDAGQAQLAQSLDSDTNLAADAANTVEFKQAVNTALARLQDAANAGLITKVQQQQMGQSLLDRVETIRTDRFVRTDPVAALHELTDDSRTANMDPVRRQQLVNQALNELDRRETENAKVKDQQRSVIITGLVAAADGGDLKPNQLNDLIQPLQLSREEYAAIRSAMERSGKEGDPEIIQQATVGVNTNNPAQRVNQAWLDSHAGQLGGQYNSLSATLRSRNEHDQDQAKDAVRYRHTQAEQILRERLHLGGSGILQQILSPNDQQLWADALESFTKLSSAYGGTEDPLIAKDQIVKQYLPQVAGQAQAAITVKRNLLKYKTAKQLADARSRSEVSTEDYIRDAQSLKDLADAQAEFERIQQEIQLSKQGQ